MRICAICGEKAYITTSGHHKCCEEDARGGSVQRLHLLLLGFPHICVSENLQFATPCGVQIFRGAETRKLFLHLASIVYQDSDWTCFHVEIVDFEQFDI